MDRLMPRSLPQRKGYTVSHVHEEGETCVVPELGSRHTITCKYRPTFSTRLRWALGLSR